MILAEFDFLVVSSGVGGGALPTVHFLVLKLGLLDSLMKVLSKNINHRWGKRYGKPVEFVNSSSLHKGNL